MLIVIQIMSHFTSPLNVYKKKGDVKMSHMLRCVPIKCCFSECPFQLNFYIESVKISLTNFSCFVVRVEES